MTFPRITSGSGASVPAPPTKTESHYMVARSTAGATAMWRDANAKLAGKSKNLMTAVAFRVRWTIHDRLYRFGMWIVRIALRLNPQDQSFKWLAEDEPRLALDPFADATPPSPEVIKEWERRGILKPADTQTGEA